MTEETTVDTPATEAVATPKPRAPKLMASIAGAAAVALLKYPFPVKASAFEVQVNGVATKAAHTGGRGKEYTYVLINNTSFYVAGKIEPGTEIAVVFPDGYAFDELPAERKSYYVPKRVPKTEGDAASTADATDTAAVDAEAAPIDVAASAMAAEEAAAPVAGRRRNRG